MLHATHQLDNTDINLWHQLPELPLYKIRSTNIFLINTLYLLYTIKLSPYSLQSNEAQKHLVHYGKGVRSKVRKGESAVHFHDSPKSWWHLIISLTSYKVTKSLNKILILFRHKGKNISIKWRENQPIPCKKIREKTKIKEK